MKGKFVGIKHFSGTSKKDGKPYSFNQACILTELSDRDVQNGAKGQDVHACTIPDAYADVLTEKNLGKSGSFDFNYFGGREYISCVRLEEK